MADDELEAVLAEVIDTHLQHTLSFGIGLHHAGLPPPDRALVEKLFKMNKIQVYLARIFEAFLDAFLTIDWTGVVFNQYSRVGCESSRPFSHHQRNR